MKREYLYDRPGTPGSAGSAWLANRETESRPSLRGIVAADVAVIGGGLCGVLTAIRLVATGAKVALVEGRRVGGLVSGHTTAKVTAQHALISANVSADVRIPWLSANFAAVDRLETLAIAAGDGAAFERAPSHVFAAVPGSIQAIEREAELYAKANLPGALVTEVLPDGMYAAARLEHQAQFDPVGLIDGLLAKAPEDLLVFEQSIVQRVEEESGVVVVSLNGGEVRAKAAVIASHVPFFDTLLYMTRLYQERSYAIEVELSTPAPSGMWYTEDAGSFSWRSAPRSDPTHLIVSGGGHKAGQGGDEREQYAALERAARSRFGEDLRVLRHWSTQDAYTPDGLPYIGKMHGRERCFMASGFQAWGMTTSAVAAEVLSVQIGGGEHELTDIVAPARVSAAGMAKLAVENADFIAKAFSHELAERGDPADVAPGFGRAMRTDDGHVAVMRTESGELRIKDAHCTHMRCGVEFNEAEGTWDCPCHGSRFCGDGGWLQGPTRRGLDPVESPKD